MDGSAVFGFLDSLRPWILLSDEYFFGLERGGGFGIQNLNAKMYLFTDKKEKLMSGQSISQSVGTFCFDGYYSYARNSRSCTKTWLNGRKW